MKVFALIKIPENPSELGAQSGDIIQFLRLDYEFSDEEIARFIPVVFDINIPCGNDFHVNIKCVNCPYNDEDLCDNIKYTRGVWGAGGIDDPPPLLLKRKYTFDWEDFVPPNFKSILKKLIKTAYEKEQIITYALANEAPTNLLIDKTV